MSVVGSCADNTSMKRLFGLLKRERVNRLIDHTHVKVMVDVFDYIERFHNPRVRHRLETVKQNELLLTQLSVKPGGNLDPPFRWKDFGRYGNLSKIHFDKYIELYQPLSSYSFLEE